MGGGGGVSFIEHSVLQWLLFRVFKQSTFRENETIIERKTVSDADGSYEVIKLSDCFKYKIKKIFFLSAAENSKSC